MTFQEALKILNIEEYGQRIWSSHSKGELFHIYDYIFLAEFFKDKPYSFRPIFLTLVAWCEKTWQRPESCFQHMIKLVDSYVFGNNYCFHNFDFSI